MHSYDPTHRPAQRRQEGAGAVDGELRHGAAAPAQFAPSTLGDTLHQGAAVRSQYALQQMLNQRPAVVAQTRLAQTLSAGRPLQREAAPDEDELLLAGDEIMQAEPAPLQRAATSDEDEILQGKPASRALPAGRDGATPAQVQSGGFGGRTIQRQPYVRDAGGQRVDIGAAHWTPATLQALLDSLPYQMADRYGRRIRREIARRMGPAPAPAPVPAAPLAAAGNAILSAQNAARFGLSGLVSAESERQPIVANSARDKNAAASAGVRAASSVVSGAVSVATGGITGYVQAGGAAAIRLAKAAQIQSLLSEAEEAARASHTQAAAEIAAPAGLADALRTVIRCLSAEAGGEAAGGVIPFAGTVVSALVADALREATATIWALTDTSDLARRAAAILGIEQGSSSTKYGSAAAGGGGGGGSGNAAASSS